MRVTIILLSVGAALSVIQAGCLDGRPNPGPGVNASNVTPSPSNSPAPQDALTGVTKIVAEILGLKPEEVEVDVPLAKQKNPADELDVVEIVLTVEEVYNVEIKDEELGGGHEGITTKLTVRRLADIVAKIKSAKK